jgi:predicted tellurium resistance membrane protein TerC
MEALFNLENLVTFLTLSSLEIVLGIDNIIFLAIIVHPVPIKSRGKVRVFGLSLAIALRILMLLGVSWIMSLTKPLFIYFGMDFSGRTLMLIAGGVFLIVKGIYELYDMMGEAEKPSHKEGDTNLYSKRSYWRIIAQIIFVDLVLSFDSVIVAVGMVNNIPIMIGAILVAMVIMLISSKAIGDFMYHNPSIKVIGILFIILVGAYLVTDGLNLNFDKKYLYFSMFFSMLAELINIKLRKKLKKEEAA